jgi:hypothetical protein
VVPQQTANRRVVADRGADWTLDGPDWNFMERQKYAWNSLMEYWFRMEMEGWEKLPEPPVLLVGIHSGATVGGPDSMPVLARGRRLARLMALDRVARVKVFPIAIQVPWGISPALLPECRCRPRSAPHSRIP